VAGEREARATAGQRASACFHPVFSADQEAGGVALVHRIGFRPRTSSGEERLRGQRRDFRKVGQGLAFERSNEDL
jgi:hypothetical protein